MNIERTGMVMVLYAVKNYSVQGKKIIYVLFSSRSDIFFLNIILFPI